MTTSQTLALWLIALAAAVILIRWWGNRQLDRGWNLGREYEINRSKQLRDSGGRFLGK